MKIDVSSEKDEFICEDSPISNIEDDLLRRKELVEDIIKILENNGSDESFTIGICGPWGSGKTSLINMVESYAEEESKPLRFIRFNPWMYSDQEKLVSLFFEELKTFAPVENSKREKISKIAGLVAPVVSIFNSTIGGLLEKYSEKLSSKYNDVSVAILKESISKELANLKEKVIIIIDDLDRLEGKEVLNIFKLVRAVADFPNIIYMLAYDEKVVSKSLDQKGFDGKLFIEKIVQLPILLPETNNTPITNLIIREYSKIVDSDDVWKTQQIPHGSPLLIVWNVAQAIRSMRVAKRLINMFKFVHSIQKENLCAPDLFGITYIRITSNEVFDWILSMKWNFMTTFRPSFERTLRGTNKEREGTLASKFIDDKTIPEEYKKLEYIIRLLFPNFRTDSYLTSSDEIYLKERRICHDTFFSHYFTLVPSLIPMDRKIVEHYAFNADSKEIIDMIISQADQNIMIEILSLICNDQERFEKYIRILMCNDEVVDDNFINKFSEDYTYGHYYVVKYIESNRNNISRVVNFINENIPQKSASGALVAANALFFLLNRGEPATIQTWSSPLSSKDKEKIKSKIYDSLKRNRDSLLSSKLYLYCIRYIPEEEQQSFLHSLVRTDEDMYAVFDHIQAIPNWKESSFSIRGWWTDYIPPERMMDIKPRNEKDEELIKIVKKGGWRTNE